MEFDYKNITNKNNNSDKLLNSNVIVSIITSCYNTKKYIEDTAKCIINQTFPFWEWIIVDDGSTNEESLNYLQQIQKMDSRIKILHIENLGPSVARDFGVNNSDKNSKYIMILDDDDIIDETYLECAYWTLETNTGASWAFTDVIHFGEFNALATAKYDPENEKKENTIVVTALIRKQDFLKVGGFGIKEKGVWEDWNLWLKMIAQGMYPVRMNFFGFWYRRKEKKDSQLAVAEANEKKAKEIIEKTVRTISDTKQGIQYPKEDYNWDIITENIDSVMVPQYEKNNKIKVLMIIPWMVMGGADKFNIDLINGLDKEKFEVTVITTEPNHNPWRELYKPGTKAVYDLTTFLDRKYWLAFINYIIDKNNINLILNTNSTFGYSILPYLKAKYNNIPIIDYIHMEEWYNRNGGFSRDSSGVASVIDKTLVCNENSKNILVNHFGRNKKEIETVYIGVNEKTFDPNSVNKELLKKKFEIPTDKKIISFIARIDLQKRPILLMQIIKKIKEKRNDCYFLIAGDGPMLKKIKELSKKYKLENNIKFMGAVSNTKEVYGVSDLTLNCSIKEGLALTSYESLSMGVPVVSANVGGQAELIDNTVGVIVPCLQNEKDVSDFNYSNEEIDNYVLAIEKVLNNLKEYKSNSRQRILNGFTIDHMIEKMSNIMEKTVVNPSELKKNNGIGLSNCIDICKELNVKYFISFKDEYNWLVNETNRKTDEVVGKIYKKNVSSKNKNIRDILKNEGKRAALNKVFIKLHVYHEMDIIMQTIECLYNLIKTCIKAPIIVVVNLLKLIKTIGARILNIFLKLIKRDSKSQSV